MNPLKANSTDELAKGLSQALAESVVCAGRFTKNEILVGKISTLNKELKTKVAINSSQGCADYLSKHYYELINVDQAFLKGFAKIKGFEISIQTPCNATCQTCKKFKDYKSYFVIPQNMPYDFLKSNYS